MEDKIIKYYPQRITALENRIEGLKQDVETAKQHPKPTDDRFVGMEVKGVFYSEKADAGKAIIEACKQMNSPDPIPLGKYRGFETELLFNTADRNYEVLLKGATSRNVPLGDDAHGNIIRLDNGIDRFPKFSESLRDLNSARLIRLRLSPSLRRLSKSVKLWKKTSRRKPKTKSSLRKPSENLFKKRGIPSQTPQSPKRTKTLRQGTTPSR